LHDNRAIFGRNAMTSFGLIFHHARLLWEASKIHIKTMYFSSKSRISFALKEKRIE